MVGVGNWVGNLIAIDKATHAKTRMIFAQLYINIFPLMSLPYSIELIFELGVWQ